MGDFSQYADLILFAMVAGFLVLRLRSVLGRRTGNERRRDPFMRRAETTTDTVVTLADRGKGPPPTETVGASGDTVARGIASIRTVDPGFDPAHFIEGARAAFEMIVSAFAAGDKARLRPLLSDEVFRLFAAAIDERVAAQETLETRVLRLKSIDIVEAGLDGRTARVTVKLVSDQINVTRAHDGSIVDGDPDHPIEKTDFWSFARDTRSPDPNWVLVATGSG
jgi:predicted lipid-binding transport protein (Tim44 family)